MVVMLTVKSSVQSRRIHVIEGVGSKAIVLIKMLTFHVWRKLMNMWTRSYVKVYCDVSVESRIVEQEEMAVVSLWHGKHLSMATNMMSQ
jgi:hypothetical protein